MLEVSFPRRFLEPAVPVPLREQAGALLDDANRVLIASDLHLLELRGGTNVDNEIVAAWNHTVGPGDVVINLGDLASDQDKHMKGNLAALLQRMKGNKILVRGNNETYDDVFYLRNGYMYVTDRLEWHGILFTHTPAQAGHGYKLNIHGHLHTSRRYWSGYDKHACVHSEDDDGFAPVPLEKVVERYKAGYYKGFSGPPPNPIRRRRETP